MARAQTSPEAQSVMDTWRPHQAFLAGFTLVAWGLFVPIFTMRVLGW
ncbi:MAG: hypothetical protein ACE5GC_01555 [Acidimicrobiia bacterium]